MHHLCWLNSHVRAETISLPQEVLDPDLLKHGDASLQHRDLPAYLTPSEAGHMRWIHRTCRCLTTKRSFDDGLFLFIPFISIYVHLWFYGVLCALIILNQHTGSKVVSWSGSILLLLESCVHLPPCHPRCQSFWPGSARIVKDHPRDQKAKQLLGALENIWNLSIFRCSSDSIL